MTFDDGPLVWVDCEMTGLDPQQDRLLEIAVRLSLNIPLVESYALHRLSLRTETSNS